MKYRKKTFVQRTTRELQEVWFIFKTELKSVWVVFRDFPYWEETKLQFYYLLHPVQHFKKLIQTWKNKGEDK